MNLSDAPEILTVDQVAEIASVNRKTVYRAVEAGQLPALRLGNTIRISKQTLVRILEPDQETLSDDPPDLRLVSS